MNVPPPIHVTGNPNLDWVILAVGALIALYWGRALRLAREGVRRFLANVAKSVVVFIVSDVALLALFKLDKSRAQGLSMCVALIALVIWQSRKRTRYIPAATKRAVIARDLPDGSYDPGIHHIDHIWPHSRGGSNTRDNTRVIEKKRNLQKGAKRPRMRDMF
jgi:5-methylcytosine-specific restriction endonuclease McrA